jgi:hypothetical protein
MHAATRRSRITDGEHPVGAVSDGEPGFEGFGVGNASYGEPGFGRFGVGNASYWRTRGLSFISMLTAIGR